MNSGQDFGLSSGVPILEAPDHARAEVSGLRMRELRNISERLGRFSKIPLASFWWATAAVLLGGAIGGGLAAFQLDPKADAVLYGTTVGAVALLGLVCLLAGLTANSERIESVRDIKTDLDALLSVYPGLENDLGQRDARR